MPGGAPKFLSAPRPRRLLATVRPRDVVGRTRRRLAAELIDELAVIDKKIKTADRELRELVAATGSSLLELHGIGPSGAARLLGDVGDISRFADRGHFASWNGTAPLDASSGDRQPPPALAGRQPPDQPGPAHHGHRPAPHDTEGRALLPTQSSPPARPRWKPCAASNAGCPTSSTTQMRADAKHREDGPGRTPGGDSAIQRGRLNPDIDTSDKSLPGPAKPKPRTHSLAAS